MNNSSFQHNDALRTTDIHHYITCSKFGKKAQTSARLMNLNWSLNKQARKKPPGDVSRVKHSQASHSLRKDKKFSSIKQVTAEVRA